MNKIYFFLFVCGLSFLSQRLVAQDETSKDENLKIEKKTFMIEGSNKDIFKEAWKNINSAELLYYDEPPRYDQALELYLKAYRYNPNVAILNYKIGICYINTVQKAKSIEYFEKAYKLDEYVASNVLYYLGRSYHLNGQWEKAIDAYQKYQKSLSPAQYNAVRDKVEKRIDECTNGKTITKKRVRVFIDNMGKNVNSPYHEYCPLISADEAMLVFTARRPGADKDKVDPADELPFEDIYYSASNTSVWSLAKSIGDPINTDGHDATVGFSPDGQQMFVYIVKGGNNGDIYVSTLKGDKWTKPDQLPKTINTDFHEADASLSPDGKTLYFVSNKPDDNFGEHDIFVSRIDAKGKWGKATNIGGVVNSKYDERGVFIHPDGRTLYFSSKGHNSTGGFDLFISTLQDDLSWSKPENVGYPINSPDDDIYFVISASGKHGYYSSIKENGMGGRDIYLITFLGPEKPALQSNEDNLIASVANPTTEVVVEPVMEIKTMRLTILKGTIKDAVSFLPLEAQIELVDNEKNEVIATFTSNSKTGKYLVSLPSGKNYGIAVKCQDYLFHSENFDIPQTSNYQEITKDIMLNKVEVGFKIVLRNIFFNLDKSDLRPESTVELANLLKLMNDYPTLKIEISGHTDNQGSAEYNKKLSRSRAKSVVEYLKAKGVVESRMVFEGYAFDQPIADNTTPEGRQQNRRVEFKILSK